MNNNLNNFLYRGQDIHNRKWVYGSLVIQEEEAFIVEYSNWIGDDYSERKRDKIWVMKEN
jgi:hypothetical protein